MTKPNSLIKLINRGCRDYLEGRLAQGLSSKQHKYHKRALLHRASQQEAQSRKRPRASSIPSSPGSSPRLENLRDAYPLRSCPSLSLDPASPHRDALTSPLNLNLTPSPLSRGALFSPPPPWTSPLAPFQSSNWTLPLWFREMPCSALCWGRKKDVWHRKGFCDYGHEREWSQEEVQGRCSCVRAQEF